MKKKAILSVSFGTKDKDLEQKTIGTLEKEYQEVLPNQEQIYGYILRMVEMLKNLHLKK